MKLINPWGLVALAVVAVVVIAYLLRMPRRQLPIPDISIWRKLSAADQKLPTSRRTLISLLLQVVIAVLLVGAYVRPYISASTTGPRHEIVMIDLSQSMQAGDGGSVEILKGPAPAKTVSRRRIDQARDTLRGIVRGMDFQDRMTLIGVGRRPVMIANGISERALLDRAIDSIETLSETADFSPACAVAAELAKGNEHTRVSVITDGSLDADALKSLEALPEANGKVRLFVMGKAVENLGITAFRARKNPNSEADFQSMVSVFNSSAREMEVPVALSLDQHLLDVKTLKLPPYAERTVVFSSQYHVGGVLKAQLFANDALNADNEALEYLPEPPRMDVALITEKTMSEEQLNSYYLAKIIKCDSGVSGGFLSAAEYQKLTSDRQAMAQMMQAAIFDNWSPSDPSQLPPGHILFINTESEQIPVAVREALNEKPLIRRWDEGHPLMNHLNLRDLFLTKVKNVELKDKAVDVVVEMISSPLILARESGGRKIVYIGFNPIDSDIQFRKELPFLLFNCFQWFKQEPEPVTQIAPGEIFTARARINTCKTLTFLPPGKNAAPERLALVAGELSTRFAHTQACGVYRILGDNEATPTNGFVVYFGDKRESDLRQTENFEAGTRNENGALTNNRIEVARDDAASKWIASELAPAGLWLALVALLIEHYVFHRRIFF